MQKLALSLICALALVCPALSQTTPPTLFFTDLQSGPATGGEAGAGAFVTVYGNFFGATPTVTIASVPATVKTQSAWLWYQRLTFQIPASVANGATTITVSNANGASNALPFTVRPGTIRFVGTQSGDQASVVACKNAMAAGDICYIRDGRNQTGQEGLNATVILNATAPITNPRAIVMYPGATATIGSAATQRAFHWCNGESACNGGSGGWVISGGGGNLLCTGTNCTDTNIGALADVAVGYRFVGFKAFCLNEVGQTACVTGNITSNVRILGVESWSALNTDSSVDHHQYHQIYWTTDSRSIEVGWSYIHGLSAAHPTGCWGIQFHSSPEGSIAGSGNDEYDIHVHDNLIENLRCGGVNFASVDPTQTGPLGGGVEAYNNVIRNVGFGGPSVTTAGCFQLDSFGGSTGSVRLFNNSMYNCHATNPGEAGMVLWNVNSGGSLKSLVTNNIFYNIAPGTCQGNDSINRNNGSARTTGTNDLWFGCTDVPSGQVNPLRVDPQFVSLATSDFHLSSTSPALHAGTATGAPVYDIEGNFRGASPSLGAYDVAGTAGPPPGQTATKQFSLTVNPAITITTTALPDATVGQPYTFQLAMAGSGSGVAWSATGLPAGLSISTAGVISGTPTAPCSPAPCSVVVSVVDSDGPPAVTATLTLNVITVAPLVINTISPLAGAKVGRPYSLAFTAGGGVPPYIWSLFSGTLPAGLTVSPAGILSGTPTAVCSPSPCSFTVQVADSSGQIVIH